MIASWMLYTLLVGGLVSVAALAAERALLLLRIPVRAVWATALSLSLLVPCLAHFLPRRVPIPPAIERAMLKTADLASPPKVLTWPYKAAPAEAPFPLGRVLLIGWAAASIGLAQLILYSMAVLYGRRREWRRETIEGVEVLVAPDFGPAVVGWRRLEIVLPAWSMELARDARALVVRHEDEHLRRRDPRLLIHASLVVLAMPWNPALWWQYRRLRRAIELDCDARVVRGGADVARYGAVLLEAGGFCRRGGLPALAAFAERAGDLEARIKALTPTRGRWRRARVSVAVVTAGVLVAAACLVPDPLSPPAEQTPAPVVNPSNLGELREWARWYIGGRPFTGDLVIVRTSDGKIVRTEKLTGGPEGSRAKVDLLRRELGKDAVELINILKREAVQVPGVESVIQVYLKPGVQLKPEATGVWQRDSISTGRWFGDARPFSLAWYVANYGTQHWRLAGR